MTVSRFALILSSSNYLIAPRRGKLNVTNPMIFMIMASPPSATDMPQNKLYNNLDPAMYRARWPFDYSGVSDLLRYNSCITRIACDGNLF